MKDESLNKALDSIFETLDKLDIDTTDKVELLINLKHFLDPLKYRGNTFLLSRYQRESELFNKRR